MGLLADLITVLAHRNAEAVFFKVQTEPGWTEATGNTLADRMLTEHTLAITDVMHANGGTIEMAQDLVRVAAVAYGTRLHELSQGFASASQLQSEALQ